MRSHIKIKTHIRKAQIKNAALAAISENGVNGMTISSIAKKVGITESNIYRHFKDKHEIAYSIISDVRGNIKKVIGNARSNNSDAREVLRDIFFRHIAFMKEHRAIIRIITSDSMYANDKKIFKLMQSNMEFYISEITQIMKDGVKKGQIPKLKNVNSAAGFFLGAIISLMLRWTVFEYAFSLEKESENVWDMLKKAIYIRP